MYYYYGIIIDLMVFSRWNKDIIENAEKEEFNSFFDACSAQCSLAIEYYNL